MSRAFAWCLAGAILAAGCTRPTPLVTVSFTGMGTIGSIVAPAGEVGSAAAWSRDAAAVVSNLEERLSLFKPGSELAKLNAGAGGGWIEVGPDTQAVLEQALAIGRDSGGAFDVTVGPLMKLWGFRGGTTAAHLPSEHERQEALRNVGYAHLVVSGRLARLDRAGVSLDAGGIGKGYAVDRCWERFRQAGVTNFLMNLGGNMRASGRPEPNRPWRVGVRNPFQEGALLGDLNLPDGQAVATSGHYERFVVLEGVKYAHILDPRTGFPVRGMAGVTVVAPTAVDADLLSTTLFVMGPEAGLEMLARTGRQAEVLFVPDRQPLEVIATPGLADVFTPGPGVPVSVIARPPSGG